MSEKENRDVKLKFKSNAVSNEVSRGWAPRLVVDGEEAEPSEYPALASGIILWGVMNLVVVIMGLSVLIVAPVPIKIATVFVVLGLLISQYFLWVKPDRSSNNISHEDTEN